MEIIKPTRAKAGYIEVERKDKYGNRKPQKVKQHIVVGGGMFSGKEMERTMRDVAEDLGVSEDQIRVQTYKDGEAPMESNPRHRGMGQNYNKRPSQPREVKKQESRPRKYWFGGI